MIPGTYFTVLDYLREPTDRSFRGDVFVCTAFEHPFVAGKACDGTLGEGRPISFDTRDWELTELTPEYVKAMGE